MMSNMHCVLFFIFLTAVETNKTANNGAQDNNTSNQSMTPDDFSSTTAKTLTTTITTATATEPETTATSGTTRLDTTEDDFCLFPLRINKKDQREVIMMIAIAALLLTCIVLLIIALSLSCKVCYLKRQASNRYEFREEEDKREMVDARSWDSQKVEGEATLMMDECNKPEEDQNEAEKKEEEKEEEARRLVAGGEAPEPVVHVVSEDEPGENGRPNSEIVFNQEDETAEQSTVE